MLLLSCCSGHCGPELGKFPQVLSFCGEEEFVFGTKRTAQAQSAKPQNSLEMRKQHLDLFPELARRPVVLGLGDLPGHIAGVFMDRARAEDARRARFVRLEMVAEVEFRSWTAEGLIRHASFRGLREDKLAEEVVLESKKEETRR